MGSGPPLSLCPTGAASKHLSPFLAPNGANPTNPSVAQSQARLFQRNNIVAFYKIGAHFYLHLYLT